MINISKIIEKFNFNQDADNNLSQIILENKNINEKVIELIRIIKLYK